MSFRCLCSAQDVRALLRYERARSDRTQQSICLVVFRPHRPASSGHHASAIWSMAQAALARARSTDVVGWFDGQSICALLPDTAENGARRFAEDVCQAARNSPVAVEYAIYAYPQEQERAEEEWSLRETATEGEVKKNCSAVALEAPATTDVGVGVMVAEERRRSTAPASEPGTATEFRPLEPLLVRSIPCWKRAFDVAASSAALLLLSPLLAAIALVVKVSSPGPVLFKQVRSGIGGIPFMLYKFRTMVADADARKKDLLKLNEQDGPAFKMKHDPRVTRVGRFLRRTSLDELPQLWNVLKGEMTLVGPRPLPVAETDNCRRWHRTRLEVTPGLTCIWQIVGRNRVTFDEWVRMDVSYINRRSILQDTKLLLQTVPAALWKKSGV